MRLTLATGLLIAGCGDKDTGTEETTDTADTAEDTTAEPDGEALYTANCAPCHGADGTGVDDLGPNIVSELHHGDAQLIGVILNGDGDMEPVNVTEEQARLIVDYMRESWE